MTKIMWPFVSLVAITCVLSALLQAVGKKDMARLIETASLIVGLILVLPWFKLALEALGKVFYITPR